MRFTLERVSGPEIEPITLAQMKAHLRCFESMTGMDDEITGIIAAAREWVEDYTGRALIDQTWRLTLGDYIDFSSWRTEWPGQEGRLYGNLTPASQGIQLRRSPILAITSIASVDDAGEETAVEVSSYGLREQSSKWPLVVGLSGGLWTTWPTGISRIEYRAGFADRTGSPQQGAEMVPKCLIQAMKLWAEAMYDRDEKMMPLLLDVAKQIAKPERAELGMA